MKTKKHKLFKRNGILDRARSFLLNGVSAVTTMICFDQAAKTVDRWGDGFAVDIDAKPFSNYAPTYRV